MQLLTNHVDTSALPLHNSNAKDCEKNKECVENDGILEELKNGLSRDRILNDNLVALAQTIEIVENCH